MNYGWILNGLGWLLDKVSGWIGGRDKLNRAYVATANQQGVVERIFGFIRFVV